MRIARRRVNGQGLALLVVALLWVPTAAAEMDEVGEEQLRLDEVTGEVTAVRPHMISIEYLRSKTASKEIMIPLDEETQLSHLRDLDDLRQGDRVKVAYQETYTEDDEGKWSNFKRVATKISLVKRHVDGLKSGE